MSNAASSSAGSVTASVDFPHATTSSLASPSKMVSSNNTPNRRRQLYATPLTPLYERLLSESDIATQDDQALKAQWDFDSRRAHEELTVKVWATVSDISYPSNKMAELIN